MPNLSAPAPYTFDDLEDQVSSTAASWNVSGEPMRIYLGQLLDDGEVATAVTNGWTEHFNFQISDTTEMAQMLSACNTQSKQCYVSLASGMASTGNIDTFLADSNFDHVDGVEVEGGSWTDTLWTYLRDELTSAGKASLLYSYQTQWEDNPGTFPNATAWNQRSKLWYPFYIDDPTQSWDPDAASSSTAITNATQANPCVITATSHGYATGDIVTIRGIVGMTELNDRQYTITVSDANTFSLDSEDSTGYTAYSSGGTVSTSSDGRTIRISRRHDPSLWPPRTMAAWKHASYSSREIHMWLQAFGQPMTETNWDDNYQTAVQPGVGHIWRDLWCAHIAGCRRVSIFNARRGRYANRHKDTTISGSPINFLWQMDANTSTTLSAQEVERYERTWTRLKNAVASYLAGPGDFPENVDNAYGVENPYVGVVPAGQSLTRLDSSTA